MSREEDEKDGASRLGLDDSKKMKPPNKKKFDEDMDGLTSQIKEKEAELERVRQAAAEIKQFKTERMECVNNRKQCVIDLERVNKEIPDRMKRLNEIEASLHYKNEDKINSAIQRLEWNLNVKTYRLTEEKKIVSEIDSLKRSKKYLVQYLMLKQEISEIRDKQKALRDGRDRCTKDFNRLKAKEEELRRKNRSLIAIKREIDALYEQRRQTNANFKQQRGEFHELKEKKHRKESWKKKAEERKVYEEDKRHDWADNETERLPHDTDVHSCLTLASYLNHLLPPQSDTSHDSLSPSSSQDDPEASEELEEGQLKLLRRSDDADAVDHHHHLVAGGGGGGGLRRMSRRSKKFRKLAMDQKISHPPDIVTQFLSLNLNPPSSLFEVPDVMEQLEKKRSFFEKEQQLCEATSDAGISATESALCVMSRQASKTESCEGGVQDVSGSSSSRPDDSVYADLFKQQESAGDGNRDRTTTSQSLAKPGEEEEEVRGAVGGRAPPQEDDDWSSSSVTAADVGTHSPNSDSTIEGDNGSGDSPKSVVVRQSKNDDNNDVVAGRETRRTVKDVVADNPPHHHTAERRGEMMKRSLAISVSGDSTDSSSLNVFEPQPQPTSSVLLVDDEFPSLLESSQTSFPSLGTSGGSSSSLSVSHHRPESGGSSSMNSSGNANVANSYKQAALSSPSSAVVRGHSPLTKTYSVIIPQDFPSPTQHDHQQQQKQQQQQQQTVPKSKSYASSVVSRARSFSEATPKWRSGQSSSSNNLNKSSSSDDQQRTTTTSPKQIQPPSSLSISPTASSWSVVGGHKQQHQQTTTPTLSSKPKPSLHRSRTLTPTLTRTWAEVRDRNRTSSGNSSGSGGGGGSLTPSGSFSGNFSRGGNSGPGNNTNRSSSAVATPTSSSKYPHNVKAQVSPSLSSSSAIPTPHKSALSPRLSYPLQSKPPAGTTPPPMIVIDSDRDFPPLSPAMPSTTLMGMGSHNNTTNAASSRRNSSLSTKSSSGSISLSLHDRDPLACSSSSSIAITATTTTSTSMTTSTSDNNNNNSSNSYQRDTTPHGLPSPSSAPRSALPSPNAPSSSAYHYNVVASRSPLASPTTVAGTTDHHNTTTATATTSTTTTTTRLGANFSSTECSSVSEQSQTQDSDLSLLPKGDKSLTEKWVESSMAFCRISEDNNPAGENATSL